jgi:quercetin dioxygenase-like cupin family protein
MAIDICTDRGVIPSVAVASPEATDVPDVPEAAHQEGCRGELARGTSRGTLRIKPPKGRTDVIFRTVTLAPGDSTGWHHHPGQIIAVVQSGTLTRILHDCSVETVSAGEAFVEPAGRKNRHIGFNVGSEPVVLYMTCLLPQDAPLSIEAEAPDCALCLS